MPSLEERYCYDDRFRNAVDTIYKLIASFTVAPENLDAACNLAVKKYTRANAPTVSLADITDHGLSSFGGITPTTE